MEREYTWFIEPLDARTNLAIFNELPASNYSDKIICSDGKQHNLWECSRALICAFSRSKLTLELKFNIYVKEGRNGPIRQCNFLYSSKNLKKKAANI